MAATTFVSEYDGKLPSDHTEALRTFNFGPYGEALGIVVTAASLPLFILPFAADIVDISASIQVASSSGTMAIIVQTDTQTTPNLIAGTGSIAITAAEALTNANLTLGSVKKIPFDDETAPLEYRNLPAGSLVGVTFGGTLTNLAGLVISITIRRVPTRRADGVTAGDQAGLMVY